MNKRKIDGSLLGAIRSVTSVSPKVNRSDQFQSDSDGHRGHSVSAESQQNETPDRERDTDSEERLEVRTALSSMPGLKSSDQKLPDTGRALTSGGGDMNPLPENTKSESRSEPSFITDIARLVSPVILQLGDTEQLIAKLHLLLSVRLKATSADQLCSPEPSILGPVIDTLRYSGHLSDVANLCANLLSTAMDKDTARFAHPGFVTIIRSLTPDEIRVLSHFRKVRIIPVIDIKKVMPEKNSEMRLNTLVSTIAVDAKCEYEDLAESYLANLERIGLLDIPRDTHLTDAKVYDRVLSAPPVRAKLKALNRGGKAHHGGITKYYAKLSVYGLQFASACLMER